MRVSVQHDIDDLASDLASIAGSSKAKLRATVRTNTREGREQARAFARRASGPHGKNYFKRITSEMLTPLVGEFGPHGGGTPVGGGWRNGPPNTDLERTQDIIGPQFLGDIQDDIDSLFWGV
jgi:hypothetical protein